VPKNVLVKNTNVNGNHNSINIIVKILHFYTRRFALHELCINLVPRVFNKDPGMVWSRASPKFSAQVGGGKVSNYMLPMGYYKKINFANY
jgi:hypothetical protein